MPETTRRPLIEVARRYGVVACVSGRRASDARRIVSLGSIAYLGSTARRSCARARSPRRLDRELQAWTRRVQALRHEAFGDELRRLRVRLEDKEAIAALHWRGVPDEEGAQAAIEEVARARRGGRLHDALGPQGAGDPAARADRQGRRRRAACCATSTSPPRSTSATTPPTSTPSAASASSSRRAASATRCGSASARTRGRRELEQEADVMVEGTDGVRDLLQALLA